MAVKFDCEGVMRGNIYTCLPEVIQIDPLVNGRTDLPDIEPLIADILVNGQNQPVGIRKDGGLPKLIFGFSRWRAITAINDRKLTPVPMVISCIYKEVNEAGAFLLNVSENRFRNDTTPVDDAHNIARMLNVLTMSEEAIAKIYFPLATTAEELKEAVKFVKGRIKLISLTPEAEEGIRTGKVKPTAAAALAKLSDAAQKKLMKKSGPITPKDVKAASGTASTPANTRKAPPVVTDKVLLRLIGVLIDDVSQEKMQDESRPYLEVDRTALLKLWEYLNPVA